MTPREAAIVSAYTGVLIGRFERMHDYACQLLGRDIGTAEMGSEAFQKELRDASKRHFLALYVGHM